LASRETFESRVLNLWMTTRVPLTRANLLFYTKVSRSRLDRWLDELVGDGVLDVDSDDEGEMVWTVRGAARPSSGPERIDELVKLEHLSHQVGRARTALAPLARTALTHAGMHGEKNLVVAGLLSFFLGPFGWLYAAPVKEAVPAALAFLLFGGLLSRLLFFLPFSLAPLFAIVGVLYAMRYNANGHRTPLLLDEPERPPALPRKR
jgi:hypothetical protein